MFGDRVLGAATATVAGWGNTGAPFSMIVMYALNEALQDSGGVSPDTSWRYTLILPGVVAAAWGLVMWYISDDAPAPDSKVRVRDLNGVGRVVSP